VAGGDDIEAGLRKIAMDDDVPANLRLGALKELGRLRGDAPPAPQPRASSSGLPSDPLLEEFPDVLGDDGHALPFDPMGDLDFAQVAGRAPHVLYAKALVRVPSGASKEQLLDAEARFLRECRDRGIDTSVDELAQRRRRRIRK
jgi:hypothetical protein